MLAAGSVFFLAQSVFAQSSSTGFGIGVNASSLGAGVEAAVATGSKVNIRGGFDMFNYSLSFPRDGVSYKGTLKLQSAHLVADFYLGHVFHISPGALVYNGNKGTATGTVGAGQTFSLGGTTYYSGQNSPIQGNGALTLNKTAPMLLLGFGNLVPRSHHFAVNVDFGAAYQGTPKATLGLTGSACTINATTGCLNAASDPTVLSNVTAEQNKINSKLTQFKYYPVVSLTLGYRF